MSKRAVIIVGVVCLAAGAAAAQVVDLTVGGESDLKDQVESLRAEIEELRSQLEELYGLPQLQQLIVQERRRQEQLELENQPLDITLSLAGAPIKGDPNAQITVVEFSDFQCPACRSFVERIAPDFEAGFVNTGKVKMAFFDFPLQRHPQAFKAAEAANCAFDQGKFWEMHDQLFSNQQQLMPEDLVNHARDIGLDMGTFQACLDSEKYADDVRADMELGQQVRLRGTPHFAIGYSRGDEVQIVRAMSGASLQKLEEVINELMEAEG